MSDITVRVWANRITLRTAAQWVPGPNSVSTSTVSAISGLLKWALGFLAQAIAGTDYVAPNPAITGATKTKVTYDAKGLVTSWTDATTADIADSTNRRYVTDAQSTVIGNTSGTNSGDNATNSQYSGLAASKEDVANKSTSVATDGASDTKYPSVKSVKDYADGLVAGLLDYRGWYDASVNTFPASGGSGTAGAVLKGDMWIFSVAGTLGGVSVQIGDSAIASVDTPGQTAGNWNILNSNIAYVPEDIANKSTTLDADKASNTKYSSAKSIYDWATGLFALLAGSISQAFQASQLEVWHATDTTITRVSAGVIAVEWVTVPTISSTSTLTNKRKVPRVLSAASYTTDTGTSLNCDTLDSFIVTAQAGALKLNNPTGTPTDWQLLFVAVTWTAARALTYDTQFEASTVDLPSTTVTTARLNMGFCWRADTSKWVILAAV